METSVDTLSRGIASTIGVFRAEYLAGEDFFKFLERPEYWSRLEGRRACFLIGGRGTGKTTALRALSFEGQANLGNADPGSWSTIGFYWRVDTSVVMAFRGRRVAEEDWQRIFAHFLNLQLTRSVLDFVDWYARNGFDPIQTDSGELELACEALGVDIAADLSDFRQSVRRSAVQFETRVNSERQSEGDSVFSVLGSPLTHLLAAIKADPRFAQHYFTFAVDEYENLAPYQQRVLNTLIKHAGDADFTFKIGVKERGIADRSTINPMEFLSEPADYTSIRVEDSLKNQGFEDFAARVCDDRLKRVVEHGNTLDVRSLFPEMAEEREAEILGGVRRRAEIRAELVADGAAEDELEVFDALPLISACMVGYWAQSKRTSPRVVLRDVKSTSQWKNRLNNYSFAMLFTLRPRVSGIRKLYAGWSVITKLADGNIRHLLALVSEALTRHVVSGSGLDSPVSPQIQTTAAEQVGERVAFELAGVHARGTEIMRLTLSLGRIFGVMAHDPHGHTPEVTQIRVDRDDLVDSTSLDRLLDAAVMHGAIVSFPGDKNSARSGDTKEHDYELHPIFAAFFAYSYRSKRRISIAARDLIALSGPTPQGTVAKILRRNSRNPASELPPQLGLFTEFFDDDAS